MRVVHLLEPGAELRVEGNRLLVVSGGVTRQQLLLPLLQRLVIHGAVHITAAALSHLLAASADVVFLSARGEYRGRLEHPAATSVELRLHQARAATDPKTRTRFAKVIVRNKLHSQHRIMTILRRQIPPTWYKAARTLRIATTTAEVTGCEGLATRAYFSVLRDALGLSPEWARRRRPPPDPVNALLSYVYTLCLPLAHTAARTVGLDPYIGLLHASGRGRPSLALDLLEELRAPFCDIIVLRALRELGSEGWWGDDGPNGVHLQPHAREWVIRTIEERLLRSTHYLPAGRALPWREVIERQAESLARAIRQQRPDLYRPMSRARRPGEAAP